MHGEDVQPPEFTVDTICADGRVHKVPHLYQRQGETWDQFCQRMKRVSDALNRDWPPFRISKEDIEDGNPLVGIIIGVVCGLLLWWAIWMAVR